MCPGPHQLLLGMWIRDLGSMIFTNLLPCKGQVLLLVLVLWNPCKPSERWHHSLTAGERERATYSPSPRVTRTSIRTSWFPVMLEAHAWANIELFRCKSFLTKDGLFLIKDRTTHLGEFHLSTWRSYPLLPGNGGWVPHPVPQGKDCGHSNVLMRVYTHTCENQLGGEGTGIHHSPMASCPGQTPCCVFWAVLLISALILWGRFCYCLYLTVKEMEFPTWDICNPQVAPWSKRQTHYSTFNRLSDLLLSP